MATKKKSTKKSPTPKKTVSPEEWGKRYEAKRSLYETFTEELHKLIEKCLSNRNIDVAQIQSRTKIVKRFVEKIQRKGEKYSNPLKDVMDLSGVRIIAYYKEDVDVIVKMIEEEFEVDWENSVNKSEELAPDRFGYRSDHYVVSLSSPRKDLVEWKPYKGLKAEIQVRTGLQHVWAERDHKLRYESFKEAPPELGRRLFRLSAVLELADAEFSHIKELRRSLKEEYSEDVERGAFDMKLNLDSLTAYLDSTQKHKEWATIAQKVGMKMCPPELYIEEEWEGRHKKWLLRALEKLGVKTVKELNELLEQASSWGEAALSTYNQINQRLHPGTLLYSSFIILSILALYSKKELVTEDFFDWMGGNPAFHDILREFLG